MQKCWSLDLVGWLKAVFLAKWIEGRCSNMIRYSTLKTQSFELLISRRRSQRSVFRVCEAGARSWALFNDGLAWTLKWLGAIKRQMFTWHRLSSGKQVIIKHAVTVSRAFIPLSLHLLCVFPSRPRTGVRTGTLQIQIPAPLPSSWHVVSEMKLESLPPPDRAYCFHFNEGLHDLRWSDPYCRGCVDLNWAARVAFYMTAGSLFSY